MFTLRPIRALTVARWRQVLFTRGTATYEYRTYGDSDGPNHNLIHFLTQELHKKKVTNSQERIIRSIENTIKFIHELDYPIETKYDLAELSKTLIKIEPSYGQKLAIQILHFLGKNTKHDLRIIPGVKRRDDYAVEVLQKIQGIGPIKARALVNNGCRSIEDLKLPQHWKMLSAAVRTSLELIVEDATKQEAEAFMTSLREVLPPDFEPHLTGSYRREQSKIPIIEIVLFHPSYARIPMMRSRNPWARAPDIQTSPPPDLLQDAVSPLQQKGLIKMSRTGLSKWQGYYKVQHEDTVKFRELHISLMPEPSKAAALLMSTGDAEFYRKCQKKATQCQMYLDGYGLFRRMPQEPQDYAAIYATDSESTQQEAVAVENHVETEWELVETPNEAALLLELGMGYIVPARRNFVNIRIPIRRVGRFEAQGDYSSSSSSNVPKAHEHRTLASTPEDGPSNLRNHRDTRTSRDPDATRHRSLSSIAQEDQVSPNPGRSTQARSLPSSSRTRKWNVQTSQNATDPDHQGTQA